MVINAKLIANQIARTLVNNEQRVLCILDLMATELDLLLKKNMLENVSKIEVIVYEKYDTFLLSKANKHEIIVPLNLPDISELKKPSGTSPYYCSDYGESHGFVINGEFRVYVYFYQLKPKTYEKAMLRLQLQLED